MQADNTAYLLAAAMRRREATAARAKQALDAMAAGTGPLTVSALAQAAKVSRSWIYTRPELCERLHELAEQRGRPSRRPSPDRAQGATVASLRRRLELSHDRVKQLTVENDRLRNQLAAAYGQVRASGSGR